MKKLIMLMLVSLMILSFSSVAFASTAVSQMATTSGGQSVADCAKTMNKGISECAHMTVCTDMLK